MVLLTKKIGGRQSHQKRLKNQNNKIEKINLKTVE